MGTFAPNGGSGNNISRRVISYEEHTVGTTAPSYWPPMPWIRNKGLLEMGGSDHPERFINSDYPIIQIIGTLNDCHCVGELDIKNEKYTLYKKNIPCVNTSDINTSINYSFDNTANFNTWGVYNGLQNEREIFSIITGRSWKNLDGTSYGVLSLAGIAPRFSLNLLIDNDTSHTINNALYISEVDTLVFTRSHYQNHNDYKLHFLRGLGAYMHTLLSNTETTGRNAKDVNIDDTPMQHNVYNPEWPTAAFQYQSCYKVSDIGSGTVELYVNCFVSGDDTKKTCYKFTITNSSMTKTTVPYPISITGGIDTTANQGRGLKVTSNSLCGGINAIPYSYGGLTYGGASRSGITPYLVERPYKYVPSAYFFSSDENLLDDDDLKLSRAIKYRDIASRIGEFITLDTNYLRAYLFKDKIYHGSTGLGVQIPDTSSIFISDFPCDYFETMRVKPLK